ncbi:MAG: twin-arginine translocase TatA/TatE family subunit [Muribaculaceae bacterium]|nr:twin-arginine translocase TatA/TatE family subunit [Muribaculaceae bacterium]
MLNSITLLLGGLQTGEIILIVVVILLLFGGKKIPELMKGIGKGVRSFKEGVNEVKDEVEKPINEAASTEEKKDTGTKSNGK